MVIKGFVEITTENTDNCLNNSKMIYLTHDEAINMLKVLSRFDGYLFGVKGDGASLIAEELDYPIRLITDKLKSEPSGDLLQPKEPKF